MELLMEFQTRIPELNNVYRRKRLLKALDRLSREKKGSLALITAPAGFGKTTLAADWIEISSESASWLSIDNNFKDEFIFIRGIITALKKSTKRDFLNTEAILRIPLKLNAKKIVFSLLKDLKSVENKINLVIDNLNLIEQQPVFDILKYLIGLMPDNLNLILISRKEIPFLIERQKIKGQIVRIKKDDLKFNYLELKKIIQREKNLSLNDNKIKKLYQITEGWPLVIEFFLFKLLNEPEYDLNNLKNELELTNNNLFQYLNQEVYSKLKLEEKEFLLKTSIVESFSVELADQLASSQESKVLIDNLLKKKIFIEAVDLKNNIFRYFNPFRNFLLSQLSFLQKRRLYLKAAAWFAENSYFQEAIFYSLQIDDYYSAVNYLEDSIPEYLKTGELKEFLNLSNSIPGDFLKNHPLILMIKAWSLFILGQSGEAAYYLNLINNKKNLSPENRGRLLTLSCLMDKYQDAEEHCSLTAEALNLISNTDYIFKINALMSLGQIQSSYLKIEESIESFRSAAFMAREKEQYLMEINSLMNLILKLTQKGSLNKAFNLNLESINRFKKSKKVAAELINLLSIPMGIIYFLKGNYSKSKDYLIKGIEAGQFYELIHVYWLPMIYYARSSFYLGQIEEAENIILETLELCNKYNLKVNYQLVEMEKLKFELINAQKNNKISILLRKKIKAKEELIDKQTFFGVRVKAVFLITELLIVETNYQQALNYLQKIDYQNFDFLDRIKRQILMSFIFLKLENRTQSRKLLLDTLILLEKESYLTVLEEYKEYLAELLLEFKQLQQEVIVKFNFKSETKRKRQNNSELIDPLTEREKEIIVLLAEGLSNKKIAEKLFITEGTTKWHLSNIYSKLAVKNRTKAAAKARKLNII